MSNKQRIKVRERIPHVGPIPIVIPLKLFLKPIGFSADSISSRVAWKFRGGAKVQNMSAVRECRSCDGCETREDKEGLSFLNVK